MISTVGIHLLIEHLDHFIVATMELRLHISETLVVPIVLEPYFVQWRYRKWRQRRHCHSAMVVLKDTSTCHTVVLPC